MDDNEAADGFVPPVTSSSSSLVKSEFSNEPPPMEAQLEPDAEDVEVDLNDVKNEEDDDSEAVMFFLHFGLFTVGVLKYRNFLLRFLKALKNKIDC